jgi:hypothetical protein
MNKKINWIFSEAYYNKQQTKKEFAVYSHTDLIQYIHDLRIQLNDITLLLNEKQQEEQKNSSVKKITADDYKQEWSYPTKILFLIAWQNKPLTSLEIHTHLKKLDFKFKNLERQQTTLSGILSRSCKSGRFNKIKFKGQKELVFVLPNWVNKDGYLIETYSKNIQSFR